MRHNRARNKARILFVDDEQRVLNSMRGMFRRDFELFLTTEGKAAIKIAAETPIDVIVADQRMPGMTGTEVLGRVKEISPNTIRILLTGYADPGAIEGSINIGEVFRFLSKPCPPKQLRETLKLAVNAKRAAQSTPQVTAPQPVPYLRSSLTGHRVTAANLRPTSPEDRIALAAQLADPNASDMPTIDSVARAHGTKLNENAPGNQQPLLTRLTAIGEPSIVWEGDADADKPWAPASIREVGIVVYTVDPGFAETALRALPGDRTTALATSLLKVMRILEQGKPGVLVTDISSNGTTLQKILSALKQLKPELVTITVSDTNDSSDMVRLINHGQIFRFLRKPVDAHALVAAVDAAALKCIELQRQPQKANRHIVDPASPEISAADALQRALRGSDWNSDRR